MEEKFNTKKGSDSSKSEQKGKIAKTPELNDKHICKSSFAVTSANQKKTKSKDKLSLVFNRYTRENGVRGKTKGFRANFLKNDKVKCQSKVTPERNSFRVTPQMIEILQLLKTVPVLPKAQKILESGSKIRQRTFYRLIKKLELYGFILQIPNSYPTIYKIHSDIEKSLCHFSEGISQSDKVVKNENSNSNPDSQKNNGNFPKGSQYIRDFSLNEKRNGLKQNKEDSSLCHFVNSPRFETLSRQSNPNNEFDEKILRSHNYFYKIPIQRKPAYLDKMLSKTIWFEQVYMKNWHYFRGKLSMFGCEAIIQFNPNIVTVWLNNIFGRNPHENNLEANKRIIKIKNFLEDSYAGLYLAPAQFLRRVENKGIEQAWVHHNLALKAKQQNITLRGRDWEIDSSKDMPELEAINDLKASEHLSEELEDFDFRAEKEIYFRDIYSNVNDLTGIIKDLQTSQIQLAGGTMTTWQIAESLLRSNLDLNERIKTLEQSEKVSPPVPLDFIIQKPLSPLQRRILEFIRKYPDSLRSDIVSKLSVKKGSVSGTVFRLKKLKLITESDSKLSAVNK